MDDALEILSDGDGLAIIGHPSVVNRFIAAIGAESREFNLARLLPKMATATQVGAELAKQSGRWVKLTKESAENVKRFGLTDSKVPGVKHLIAGEPGKVKKWLQVADSPATRLANPAMLAGAATIMSQLAMEQQIAEITDYLAVIDEKLDQLLKTQINSVLADVDAAALAIREGMSIRDAVGIVSDVTWSKVQGLSVSILTTQAFALRQLSDIAEKLEAKSSIDDLLKAVQSAEPEVQKWLKVLARCFQLQDSIAVLELDRVFDANPAELDAHRRGLHAARQDRLKTIASTTEELLLRMHAAADAANSGVLWNPRQSPGVVKASSRVTTDVYQFRHALGVETEQRSVEATRWKSAAAERLVKVRETGGEGIEVAKDLASKSSEQAKQLKNRVSDRLPRRGSRRPSDDNSSEGG